MSFRLLKPELYSRDHDGRVTLKGGRCSICGHVFFPMQMRGCERCGAHGEAIAEADLGSGGRLVSAATVHVHAGKSRTAPFVIGVIELDSGPRVRTLIEGMADAETRNGAAMRAALVDVAGRDSETAQDLRFQPA